MKKFEGVLEDTLQNTKDIGELNIDRWKKDIEKTFTTLEQVDVIRNKNSHTTTAAEDNLTFF